MSVIWYVYMVLGPGQSGVERGCFSSIGYNAQDPLYCLLTWFFTLGCGLSNVQINDHDATCTAGINLDPPKDFVGRTISSSSLWPGVLYRQQFSPGDFLHIDVQSCRDRCPKFKRVPMAPRNKNVHVLAFCENFPYSKSCKVAYLRRRKLYNYWGAFVYRSFFSV